MCDEIERRVETGYPKKAGSVRPPYGEGPASQTEVVKPYLKPAQLAYRWNTTEAALSQLRYRGVGPAFFRIGRSIRYPQAWIEEYERTTHRASGE